jgi:hypothetical protein
MIGVVIGDDPLSSMRTPEILISLEFYLILFYFYAIRLGVWSNERTKRLSQKSMAPVLVGIEDQGTL